MCFSKGRHGGVGARSRVKGLHALLFLSCAGVFGTGCAPPGSAKAEGLEALAAGRWEVADSRLRRASEQAPGDAEVLNALAAVEANAGRGQAALDLLYRALETREDYPEARLTLARLLVEVGGLEPARRQVARVLETHPAHAEALTAAAQLWRDEPLLLAAWLQKAAEAEPTNPGMRLRYAHALLAGGETGDALRAFTSLTEEPCCAEEAWRGLADVWAARGVPDLRIFALTRAAAAPRAGLGVKTELARALLGHADPVVQAQGGELVFQLLDQAPEDPELNFTAGTLFDDAGDAEMARLHYLGAVANGCRNPRAALYLGESYARTGEPDKAREVLESVAEAEPEASPWRVQALALLGKLP